MIRHHLKGIEINVAERHYSYVSFHFFHVKQTVPELKQDEVRTIGFCRSLLDDVYDLIAVFSGSTLSGINKLVQPNIKYGETYDKEHRYFEVLFTLGNVKVNSDHFQKFCCYLVLRSNEGLHTIDYGRFDFEFQPLRQHRQYINCVEGFHNETIICDIDTRLEQLAIPVKGAIEKVLDRSITAVHLEAFESEEYGHFEGSDNVLVSSGIILGSSIN